MGFWDQPQGAAIFKHAVLDRYAPIFASKTGKFSPGGRVEILDGYAGRGWYEDGSPGSPARMIGTAQKLAGRRRIRCWFVEENRRNYDALVSGLADHGVSSDRAVPLFGTMAEHLHAVLEAAQGIPLFAFIDPFGIGLPFDLLTGALMRRPLVTSGVPPTEVLINFVHAGIYRNAGQLDAVTNDRRQLQAAERKIADLDSNLGGRWWRDHWLEKGHTDEFVDAVRTEYIQRVLDVAGPEWGCFGVPVSDTQRGSPIYDLLLFTRHPHGTWFFNNAVSLARQVFQTHCEEGAGILQPPLWEPGDEWISIIRANLSRLLASGAPVRVIDRVGDVYGSVLGVARESHVKAAASQLIERRVARGDLECEPWRIVLEPTHAAAESDLA